MRWRGKASKMPNHPSEKNQARMVMKNLVKSENLILINTNSDT